MKEHERQLWTEYDADRTNVEARNRLADHYFGLVVKIAKKRARHIPERSSVLLGDLVTYGGIGLLQAIERFDLSRKMAFSTFAGKRVLGAMLDGLREMDDMPRTMRERNEAPAVWHTSAFEVEGETRTRSLLENRMSCCDPVSPMERLDILRLVLQGLSYRERIIVTEHYCHGVSMHQIGQSLGINGSRVSQIMKDVRQRILERWPNGIDAA